MTVIAVGESDVAPGLLAFFVVAAIGVALYFLVKSMNKQISKIEVPHAADLDKHGPGGETGPEPDEAAGEPSRHTGKRAQGK